jgi:hypothetical protein
MIPTHVHVCATSNKQRETFYWKIQTTESGARGVLQGWLLDWLSGLQEKELALGIMVIYQIWLARNEAREEAKIEDPHAIARRSIHLVEEWAESRTVTMSEA